MQLRIWLTFFYYRHQPILPTEFRIGDMVEAQFGVFACPIAQVQRGTPLKYQLRLVLCALCLEDSSETDVSSIYSVDI